MPKIEKKSFTEIWRHQVEAPVTTPARPVPGTPDRPAVAPQVGLGALDPEIARNLETRTPAAGKGILGVLQQNRAVAEQPSPRGLARFEGNEELARICRGQGQLGRGAHGEGTRIVQQTLSDMGYTFLSGIDGKYGRETIAAVKAFQVDRGLNDHGNIDRATVDELRKLAPPPGQQATLYPEYHRLFEDGVLDVTLAIGYDEGGSHQMKALNARRMLAGQGFSLVTTTDPVELMAIGIDPTQVGPGITCYHRTFEVDGKEIQSVVRMITPETSDPKAGFTTGLHRSDVVYYSGHGRYGTGPDFDAKESPGQNFVIGTSGRIHDRGEATRGYDAHMNEVLENSPNDLEAQQFDPDRYQLWFFRGCSTMNYLDELRGVESGKDRGNLDIIATTRPTFPGAAIDDFRDFLTGIMGRQPINDMFARLEHNNEAQRDGAAGDLFIGDGFAGNRYRPD